MCPLAEDNGNAFRGGMPPWLDATNWWRPRARPQTSSQREPERAWAYDWSAGRPGMTTGSSSIANGREALGSVAGSLCARDDDGASAKSAAVAITKRNLMIIYLSE